MKAYRNLRIGAKLSLVLSIVLIIGLGLLSFSSTTALSSSMRNTAEDRFMELADARATVVEQYMVGFRRFIKAFGTEDIIEMDLEDSTNEQLTQSAQACIEKYKDTSRTLNILEMYGTENSSPAYERASGFRSIIKDEPKFKIIHSESGDFLRSKGHEIGSKIISFNGGLSIGKYPIDIIFSHNDAMTWGVLDAFYEHEIDPHDVTIVTIDGEKKSIEAIKNGSIKCVIECNPNTGEKLCSLVKNLIDGKPIPPISYVDGAIYTEFDDFSTFEGKGF